MILEHSQTVSGLFGQKSQELQNSNCQAESLNLELKQREQAVYQLVQHSHELSARLNDRTTENARLNRKIINLSASQTELKSRFIEALKKLKATRGLVKQVLELAVSYSAAFESLMEGLKNSREFDFNKFAAYANRLKIYDLRFAVGINDCREVSSLIEHLQLVDTKKLTTLYHDLLAKTGNGEPKVEGCDGDGVHTFQSLRSINRFRLDGSSIDVSLMQHQNTKNIDISNEKLKILPMRCLKASNNMLSDSEDDINSIEQKKKCAVMEVGAKDQLSVEKAKSQDKSCQTSIDGTNELFKKKQTATSETNQLELFKKKLRNHTMSLSFMKWDSPLAYYFVHEHVF